jgi:hypothetical protein
VGGKPPTRIHLIFKQQATSNKQQATSNKQQATTTDRKLTNYF